ncbi:hypothetical protein [Streptacidiphilus albus]|uniref:hypothetical protein n=1 Tax=Streptacidiphilus albus TaxID=105425 RepID=UPI00054BAF5F|nr:hypothetical protein [Streptacidiphilus albus]
MVSRPAPDTLMWEVRAVPGALDELLAWVERQLAERGAGADVYLAADDRIVVILRTTDGGGAPVRLPEPPAGLLARPVHQWPFAFHCRVEPGPPAK